MINSTSNSAILQKNRRKTEQYQQTFVITQKRRLPGRRTHSESACFMPVMEDCGRSGVRVRPELGNLSRISVEPCIEKILLRFQNIEFFTSKTRQYFRKISKTPRFSGRFVGDIYIIPTTCLADTKKIYWPDFIGFRPCMFKIHSISHEICNIFKSKPCYETKKIYFYIPRFVHLFTKITVYSAARVATFTGIYQGSRLLSTQGQHRLSYVQANWCLIIFLNSIRADSCHTVFGPLDPMLLYPGVTALHI